MKNWQYLQKGDLIDLVAPSWKLPGYEIKEAIEWVESLGLRVRKPKDLIGKDLFCSNSLEARTRHLKAAIIAKDSSAIWSLRGGHGAAEILPALERLKPTCNKYFIGFSDITSLHAFFNSQYNWKTLHGPNIGSFTQKEVARSDENELKRIIFGKQSEIEFKKLKVLNKDWNKKLIISSQVFGGNLAVFASLIGTRYLPDLRGKLLFFEDVGERGYRIDRLLVQFEQSGLLKGVRGIVLGTFLGGNDHDGKSKVMAAWKQFASRQKFPVLSGVEAGHGRRLRVMPLNTAASLSIESSGKAKLTCKSGGVRTAGAAYG